MNRHAKPISRCSSWNRSSTLACTETSSADVGSSAISNRGLNASALAMPTRWRWPPDSSWGYRLRRSRARCTWSRRSSTRLPSAAPFTSPWSSSGSPIDSPIGRRGLSDDPGSWKTKLSPRLHRAQVLLRDPDHVDAEDRRRALQEREQPDDRASDRRLPRAGLADEADDLALADRECHVVDGSKRGGPTTLRVLDDHALQIDDELDGIVDVRSTIGRRCGLDAPRDVIRHRRRACSSARSFETIAPRCGTARRSSCV